MIYTLKTNICPKLTVVSSSDLLVSLKLKLLAESSADNLDINNRSMWDENEALWRVTWCSC